MKLLLIILFGILGFILMFLNDDNFFTEKFKNNKYYKIMKYSIVVIEYILFILVLMVN